MADTMQFDLVSPERRLASLQARAVQLPGAEGDMTAMPDHAPIITTLRPGILSVETDSGSTEEFFVTGGFAQIASDGTTVLAEAAVPKGEVTPDFLSDLVAKAREAQSQAKPEGIDAAGKLVADMVAIGDQIGIPVSSSGAAP